MEERRQKRTGRLSRLLWATQPASGARPEPGALLPAPFLLLPPEAWFLSCFCRLDLLQARSDPRCEGCRLASLPSAAGGSELFPFCLLGRLAAACGLGPTHCSSIAPLRLQVTGLCLRGLFSSPSRLCPLAPKPASCLQGSPSPWVPLVPHHLERPP